MRVIAISESSASDVRGAAAALGNFDGVHLGHQAVIANARAIADKTGAPLAAAIFDPHPKAYFQRDARPFRLQSDAQRESALAVCGVSVLFKIQFTDSLAAMSDTEFAEKILGWLVRIGASHVSVGFDYHYGRARMADADTLREHGALHGFGVSVVDPVTEDGVKISSTAIRTLLSAGEPGRAGLLLTRPFAIEGTVVHGFKRGREIGVPTANLALGGYTHPRYGVYAAEIGVGGATCRGIANCGVKPTIAGDHAPQLETHIFDFNADLYGRTIEVRLLHFLRDEMKFPDITALRDQITMDIDKSRALLG